MVKFATSYTTLKNGVRSLVIPMPGVESVTALVLVKTGSRNEEEPQAGISHILEHLLLKASKKYPNQMMLASTIDSMGAEHNAFTSKEFTGYYITAAGRHLSKSLEILGDVVTNPLLKEESIKTELGVIVEEYNMFEDLPMRRAMEEWENLLYEGTPMGRFIEGSPETIRATTRKGLKEYLARWYKGGNILVVVAGKVNNQSTNTNVQNSIQEYFGEMEKGEMEPYVSKARFGERRSKFVQKKTEQAHFVLGVPGVDMKDPRRYALQLAQVVLGGNMSSRLFDEIREKRGLAYYVQAISESEYDSGYFAVRAGVKLSKLGEATKVVRSEMLRLGRTITEKELRKGKD
ncbi:insulinase family protein, partial [Patescibacteria group bacterium]|nr:insulinase family protein [Patescibacteria group bacterium]